MKNRITLALGAAVLAGCSTTPVPGDAPTAQARIEQALKEGATPRAAGAPTLPQELHQSMLPPLRSTLSRAAQPPSASEPRFDLVVTDAPIAQVLQAIVSDTRYSVLLSPKVNAPQPAAANAAEQPQPAGRSRELLSVALKNVTVLEALDAIRDTYGYEYSVQGTRIFVEPPDMQTRFYQVNYTLGQRRGVSDLQVISGASTSGGGSGGNGGGTGGNGGGNGGNGGNGGGSSYGSSQASALTAFSKSDLWGEIEDSLRTLLGCNIPRQQAAVQRAAGAAGQQSASNRADVSFPGDANLAERQRGVEGCSDGRAVHVNQMSGTVLVRGMPRELRTVERLLRAMQLNVERQVIIEAKVIDVQLNRESQQGINWAAFKQGVGVGLNPAVVGSLGTANAGAVLPGATLSDLLGAQLTGGLARSAFSAGLGLTLQRGQFASLISFLETQGEVQVLSSPRIATLNNQKAVIKVGTEEPFVTSITPGSTSVTTGTAVAVQPTLTYQPFFSGISLDVTPQIDDRDRVTLHVHALVNNITEKLKAASTQAGSSTVPLAVSSVHETDSVVKTADGTMVVIGGLMMETSNRNRARVPGLGEVPVAGALFGKRDDISTKRELVILIKPTVVRMESDWADDIAAAGRRVDDINGSARSSRWD